MKHRLLIEVLAVSLAVASLQAQVNWTRYPRNPVMQSGLSLVMANLYAPAVLRDSLGYRMWFSGRPYLNTDVGYRINAAYSPNGYDWYLLDRNPVLTVGSSPNDFDWHTVNDPFIIKWGGALLMYYTGWNGTISREAVATSLDGLTWQKQGAVLTPIAGTWESGASNNSRILQVGDSLIMLYTGTDGSTLRIGRATSRDGYLWTRDAMNPILQPGPPGSWDAGGVFCMGFLKRDSLFYLFYQATPKGPIGLALSRDSRTWTRYSGNPVFSPGAAGTWEQAIAVAYYLLEGDTVKCWYAGEGPLGYSIGYATSPWISLTLGVGAEEPMPNDFRVTQNYPNPFNPGTVIAYDLPERAEVSITVFDLLGQEVATILKATQERGPHTVSWLPQKVATGTYLCRVKAGEKTSTIKLMYMK